MMLFRSQSSSVKRNRVKGFTLIEVLLVIAILAILAAVVIVAINPAKQFGEAQNSQRRSDVRSILDAIHQYSIDNYGSLPSEEIPSGTSCIIDGAEICLPEISCEGVSLDELLVEETYLTDLPTDPSSATDVGTGYFVFQNGNGRIGVCAPTTYGDIDISVVR